jgi:hypothetical protein
MVKVTIDDSVHDARGNERLIDLLNRIGTKLAQVCYHPQLGPIQTCDTCLLETNGGLRQHAGAAGSNCRESAAARQFPLRPSHASTRRRGGTEVEAPRLQSSGQRARTSSNEIGQVAG